MMYRHHDAMCGCEGRLVVWRFKKNWSDLMNPMSSSSVEWP